MISRPSDLQSSRRRRFGLGGSLIAHVLALALFVVLVPLFVRPERPERATTPEIVTITRRPHHPTPAPVAVRPRPTPQPVAPARVVPVPRPISQPRVAALVPPAAPVHVPKAPIVRRPPTVPHLSRAPAPRHVALAPGRSAPVGRAAPRFSQSSIDRIEGDLAKAIGHDRAGIDPLHVAYAPPAPPKDYGPATNAFDVGDARNHHGLCDPVKSWNEQGYDYYYVSCNVRFSDGSFQRQGVPWPVRFPPGNDPFNGTAKGDLPLAMPLPGWTLAAGENITPELREYAAAHGVAL